MNIRFIGDDPRFEFATSKLKNYSFSGKHVILPMRGLQKGEIDEQTLAVDALYYFNNQTRYFNEIVDKYKLLTYNLNDDEDFCRVNNLATSLGVLSYMISLTSVNLDEMKVLIIGYGHSGKSLQKVLSQLESNVTIAVRRKEINDELAQKNIKNIKISELANYIYQFDVIINTVPRLIIDDQLLRLVNPDVLILDIASSPGGVDYHCAKTLGIKAFLLPGLPGKISPKSSGEALAKIIIKKEQEEKWRN